MKPREPAAPAAEPWSWLTQAAFVLALAIVAARALMMETLRDPFQVSPGSTPVPGGPGAGTSLVLDLLCCCPMLLVLVRRALDPAYVVRRAWSAIAFFIFAIFAALSVAWSADRFAAAVDAAHVVAAAALLWAGTQLVRSWLRLRIVAGLGFGLLLAYTAHGLIYRMVELPDLQRTWETQRQEIFRERGWDPDSFEARQFGMKITNQEMIGFSASPNTFAAAIVLLMVVSIGAAVQRLVDRDEIGWAVAIALALPVALVILWLTHSRTALATLVLAIALLASLFRLRPWLAKHARLAYAIGAIAFSAAAAAIVAHGIYHGSLFHDSLTFRWRYWVGSFRLFREHPLLGVGWNNFGPSYLAVRMKIASEEIKDPHNFLVRAFVELGIVGGTLMLAWMAMLWWALTRPRLPEPPAGLSARPAISPPLSRAVMLPAAIALAALLLNWLCSLDFSQDINFLFLETIKRALYACLIVAGILIVALRSMSRQVLDDRPAPWMLYGMLAALAGFLVHCLVDVAMFETGTLMLFALLAGCCAGIRHASSAGQRRRTALAGAGLALVAIALAAAALLLVLPVTEAQRNAHDADEALRRGRFADAVTLFREAHERVGYNADYPFRAAGAMIYANLSADSAAAPRPYTPEQIRAWLDIAIATDPTAVPYYLSRARAGLRGDGPIDQQRIRSDFEKALSLDPNDVSTRLEYAQVLEQFHLPQQAAEQYAQALAFNAALHPDEPKRLPQAQVDQITDKIRSLRQQGESGPSSSQAVQ